ncbi:MAG: flagellar basal body rod protein FlgB [Thiotrichales bacterium]|nr:flagellar basal body rod protein FlgB [Thiotrichales bacterium]
MNLDKAFGIHATALIMRSKRAELLASNIANADTPNYKSRDINFSEVLSAKHREMQIMASTSNSHMQTSQTGLDGFRTYYRVPNQPSVDGNTVDSQLERSAFMENSIMYQTSLRFLNGRISGLLTAIKGE